MTPLINVAPVIGSASAQVLRRDSDGREAQVAQLTCAASLLRLRRVDVGERPGRRVERKPLEGEAAWRAGDGNVEQDRRSDDRLDAQVQRRGVGVDGLKRGRRGRSRARVRTNALRICARLNSEQTQKTGHREADHVHEEIAAKTVPRGVR